MKKIKSLLALLLIIALMFSMASCYIISGRKMTWLKGTYKLTNYTYTPSHERKEGYTPTSYDYINDEEYLYEDYLVITGTGMGYYVHKDATGECYVKEVTLKYLYDQEGEGKVEYVIHNDAVSKNSEEGVHKMGVNRKVLNYSKSAIDYTQIITKKRMRTEQLYVRWEKVSSATDLSYVEKQVGSLKEYSYEAFGVRGIYEISSAIRGEEHVESEYQYLFYVLDTAKGKETAKLYYANKSTPLDMQVRDITLTPSSDGWSSFSVDGVTWQLDPEWGTSYLAEADGISYTYVCRNSDISTKAIEYLINSRIPAN